MRRMDLKIMNFGIAHGVEGKTAFHAHCFQQSHNAILALASRYFKNQDDAKDAVHDFFEHFLQWPEETLRKPENLGAYILRSAKNHFINALEKGKRNIATTDLDNAANVVALNQDPLAALIALEDKNASESLINQLPLPQQEVFRLRLEGFEHNEIAELLGITQRASIARLNRAKEAIQKIRSHENATQNSS